MAHTFDEKTTAQLNRAKEHFEKMIGKADRYLAVHAPGRSEIAGNHTDHEGGHVIAGALDVAINAICAPNNLGVIRVASVGYDPFEVDYTILEPSEAEYLTTQAIVRGMAANLVKLGFEPTGFDMAVVSDVPGGGGLSSSAAFEAAAGRAMEALWEGDSEISAVKLAQMSQNTENVYFGKPCGLMDQLAVCLGGLAFANAFLGMNHSMAHKLGAFHHIPHGWANAVILTRVMRYNSAERPTRMGTFPQYDHPKTLQRYAQAARFCGVTGKDDAEVFEKFVAKIGELFDYVGVKHTIAEYGVDEKYFLDSLDAMTEQAFNDQCTGANPRYPLMSEMKELYLDAYYGREASTYED